MRDSRFVAALLCVLTIFMISCGGGGTSSAPPPPPQNPNYIVSSAQIGFGGQLVGSTQTQTVTVTNNGNASLVISSVAITGPNASEFKLLAPATPPTPASPITLAANSTLTIQVSFTPGGTGTRTANVAVTDNASGSPHSITLTGTGTAPALVLPGTIQFGAAAVSGGTVTRGVIVDNTKGSGDLLISSIGLSGANAADFSTSASGVTVSAGTSKQVNVTFKAGALGTRSASLTFTDNAAGSPHSVALGGTGVAAGPQQNADASIAVSPDTLPANTTFPVTVPVTITGTDTNFVNGATVANFGPGAAVSPDGISAGVAGAFGTVQVTSQTTATAQVTFDSTAVAGPRFVMVMTGGHTSTATFTVASHPGPAANAGATQFIDLSGSTPTAHLDGSGSAPVAPILITGANGSNSSTGNSLLAYQWTLLNVPDGSTTALADPNSVRPNFVVDKAGNYVAELTVTDGSGNSSSAWIFLSSLFSLPVAHAGDNQFVATGATVQLDGSGSTDAGGATLTYSWKFLSMPTGSAATLSNANAVAPTFVADLAGTYRLQLMVNDGQGNTASDTVLVSTTQTHPIAKAGPAQKVKQGDKPQLDGSGSSDPDGEAISCSWALVAAPAGSTAQLTNAGPGPCSVKAGFTVDQLGDYVALLTVTDAVGNTAIATVLVSTDDVGPTANAGTHQLVNVNDTVQLDGSKSSDPDNDTLTYKWSLLSKPNASKATLGSATTATPTFVADVVGDYVCQLVVTDSLGLMSSPATVRITAAIPGFSVDHSSLGFGIQTVNTTSNSSSIVITNTGGGILDITALTKAGSNPGDFAFTNASLPISVQPGATTTINVTFTPSATGARSATLNIVNNATGSSAIQLSGTGGVPVSQFTPTSLTFTGQAVGTTSQAQTVTVKNTGTTDLKISGISITGANITDFSVTPTTAQTVAPNASIALSVTFTPTVAGGRGALLTLVDNASAQPETVALNGTGTAPGISANPTSVGFNNQLVKTTSSAQTVTITNTGTADLHISALAIDVADFATTAVPVTVTPNSTTPISLTFTPSTTGNRAGTLTITYDAGKYTISLTGTGIAPDINADKTVTFTDTLVGSTTTMPVNIANSGTAPLTVSGVVLSDTTNFQVADFPSAPIPPGNSATAHISFKPTTRGSHPATATINSDAFSGPATVTLAANGLQPGISLSTNSLTFPDQLLNTASSALPITVTNTGNSPLHITALTPGGTNAVDFNATNSLPMTVAANNGTSTINVVFKPSALGLRNGTLTITNDAGAALVVTLSGKGTQPAISAPASVTFADQSVTTTGNATLTITNPGTAPLHITSLAITSNAAEFSVTTVATVQNPVVVQPNNGTTTINLTFTPAQIGNRAGTLTIASDAPTSPTSVSLSGKGTAAQVGFSPNPLNFGSQLVATPSGQNSLTITNSGNVNLVITNLSFGGTNPGDFGFAATFNPPTSALPITVSPNGGTTSIPIIFTPAAVGNRSATLLVTDNASGSPQSAQLSGVGTAPGAPTFSPAPVTFNQVLGTTSAVVQVSVTNPASATGNLVITNIAISGSNAGDFATTTVATPGSPITVAPGASTIINLTFAPGAAGPRSGLLTITDNAPIPGSTHSVTLSGTGSTSNISPTSLTFAAQPVGTTSAAQTVTFAYPAGASGTLKISSAPVIAGANAAEFAVAPFTLPVNLTAPGQNQLIRVTFSPVGAAGARSATLTITDSTGSYPITLSGTAQAPIFSASPLAFADTLVNTSSAVTPLTINNTGSANLHISAVSISGPNSSEFAVAAIPPAGLDVAPGANVTLNLTFKPAASGARSATLNVTDNAVGSPHGVALSGNGVAPVIGLPASPFNVGSQTVNDTSSPVPITINNTGNYALTISSVTITGGNASDFNATPSSLTVQPGNSGTINVTFKPSTAGAETTSLVLTDNATGSPHILTLNGTGVLPGISVSPNPIALGSQLINNPSNPLTVTISNPGPGTLHITGLTISGVNFGDFSFPGSFVVPTSQNPLTVAANGSTTIGIIFAPSTEGFEQASLTITSNASPTSVSITGTGVAPHFSTTPSPTLTFVATQVGSTRSATVTLTNSGGFDLTITAINTSGANPGDFTFSPAVPITVPKNSTVNLNVVFAPSINGAESATFSFVDNAANSPQSLALSGSGTAPIMGPLPPFTFPSPVFVGSTSAPQSYQISNTGSAPMKITGLSFSGGNAGDFATSTSASAAAPLIVPAGGGVAISLTFTPSATGTRTTTLVITDNTGPGGTTVSTDQVALTGTGQPLQATPVYNPTSLTFSPNQLVGTTSLPLSIGVTNNGNGDMTITSIGLSGAAPNDFAVTTALPITVGKNGGAKSFNVTFTPSDQGTRNATMTVNATNVSDGTALPPQTITLTGTGFYNGHFVLNPTSIGANLQVLGVGSVDVAPSSPMTVTIASSDATLLLIEPNSSDPNGVNQGSGSVTVTLNAHSNLLPGFWIQALKPVGSPTLTISSAGSGYQPAVATITLTPSGFVLTGPAGTGNNFNATLGTDSPLTVNPVQLDGAGNVVPSSQPLRGGAAVSVNVSSATTAVGTILSNPAVVAPGSLGSSAVSFHPVSGGTSVLSVVQPSGFSTPVSGAQLTATVKAPTINLNPLSVGFHLQSPVSGQLSQASTSPVSVTVSSSDSTKLLVTADPTLAGQPSIVLTVPANQTVLPPFYVQGLASSGVVPLLATASGYSNSTGNVALLPSGVVLTGPKGTADFSTTSISSPTGLTLTLWMLDTNLNPFLQGVLSPGTTATASVSSGTPSTGGVNGGPVQFNPGDTSNSNLTFQPVPSCTTPCTTLLSVVQPAGFATPASGGGMTVTVNKPMLTLLAPNATVGQNLEVGGAGSLDAGFPSDTLLVTITSNNPSVLLAASATAAGTSSLTLSIPPNNGVGGIGFPSYFIQSVNASTGTATLTATVVKQSNGTDAGYNVTPVTITLAPAALVIASNNGIGANVSASTNSTLTLTLEAVLLNPTTLSPTLVSEPLRGGFSATLSVSSDNGDAVVTNNPITISGGNDRSSVTVQIGSVSGVTANISIVEPASFAAPASGTLLGVVIR